MPGHRVVASTLPPLAKEGRGVILSPALSLPRPSLFFPDFLYFIDLFMYLTEQ